MNSEELIKAFTKPDGRTIISTSKSDRELIPVLIGMTSFCPDYYSPRERLEVLKLGFVPECKSCGTPAKFINNRWQEYCSRECVSADKEFIAKRSAKARSAAESMSDEEKALATEKRKQTCQERFGGNAPLCSPEVRAKMQETMVERYDGKTTMESGVLSERMRETMVERYGDVIPTRCPSLMEKIKTTNQERYGVEWAFSSPDIIKKKEETNLRLYGHTCSLQNEDVKLKSQATCLEKYGTLNPMQNEEVKSRQLAALMKNYGVTNPGFLVESVKETGEESKIIKFLNEIKVPYEYRNTDILERLELVFLFREKNFAVEVNGLYWHSEKFKTPFYHELKFRLAQDKGIKLIQFWDCEVKNKFDLVGSMISANVGVNNRLYARKCSIVNISANKPFDFLEANHIQGGLRLKSKGLLFDGKLVAIMIISEGVLRRFCSLKFLTVVGGFSKLLNSFSDEVITTYSDNRYSDGSLYLKNGFTIVNETTAPKYYYTKTFNELEPRWKFMKKNISHLGDIETQTEKEIMKNAGYTRVYGCCGKTFLLERYKRKPACAGFLLRLRNMVRIKPLPPLLRTRHQF